MVEAMMLLLASASLDATARNADASKVTLSAPAAVTMALIATIKVYSYRYMYINIIKLITTETTASCNDDKLQQQCNKEDTDKECGGMNQL